MPSDSKTTDPRPAATEAAMIQDVQATLDDMEAHDVALTAGNLIDALDYHGICLAAAPPSEAAIDDATRQAVQDAIENAVESLIDGQVEAARFLSWLAQDGYTVVPIAAAPPSGQVCVSYEDASTARDLMDDKRMWYSAAGLGRAAQIMEKRIQRLDAALEGAEL